MAQITIEMVDQVLDRLPYATYKEAREALIKTDGNVLDAIIYIESGQKDMGFENKNLYAGLGKIYPRSQRKSGAS